MNTEIVQSDDTNKEISIFNEPIFPSKTKPYNFTPAQLKDMLIEYSQYKGNIRALCESHRIDNHSFFMLCRTYPEIESFYSVCQANRAEYMAAETIEIADSGDDDVIMNVDRAGNEYFQPNMAKVRRDELRIKQRNYILSKYNREKYGDKQVIESTSKSFHLHAHTVLPPVSELEDIGLDGLINIQRDMRYGQSTSQQSGSTRR